MENIRRVLILNGSPSGDKGNCAFWIKEISKGLKGKAEVDVVHLAKTSYGPSLKKKIELCSGVIFITGTYWDSWGSPLQRLLEDMTELEASSAVMGKPAAVFVLKHSVGGKSVLSRLQGVLSTFGFLNPPMCGMVYSLVSDIALSTKSSHAEDFWSREDSELLLQNFLLACDLEIKWASWPVDKKNPRRRWLR